MNNKAWIIFISSDNYVYYALNLYKSLLDTKTKFPVYCGVTKDVSTNTVDILKKVGINIIYLKTDNILNSKAIINSKECQKYKNAFTKLGIFNETQFSKIVYLDVDLHIFENIDDLFDKPHMSAVIDLAPFNKIKEYKIGCSIFCSGLFVYDFNYKQDTTKILSCLNNLPNNISWHDQNVLNYLYQNWKDNNLLHLDPTYGLMTDYRTVDLIKNPKIRHYVMGGKEYIPFDKKEVHYNQKIYNYVIDYYIKINDSIKYFNNKFNLTIPLLKLENIKQQNKVEPINNLKNNNQATNKVKANYYLYF